MQEIMSIFSNEEFGSVRTLMIDNNPWFVGKDVAIALGYKDSISALKKHVKPLHKRGCQIATPSGVQYMTIIDEPGLYSMIFGSKLESAERFQEWVYSDVLPQIRETGGYGTYNQQMMKMLETQDRILNRLETQEQEITGLKKNQQILATENQNLKNENDDLQIKLENSKGECQNLSKAFSMVTKDFLKSKDEIERLHVVNKAMAPKVVFYDLLSKTDGKKGEIHVSKMAALLSNKKKGIYIGEQALFQFLRQKKLLCSSPTDWNKPSYYALKNGYMTYSEFFAKSKKGRRRELKFTPHITGKGQKYIAKKVMENLDFFQTKKKVETKLAPDGIHIIECRF